MSIAGSQQRTFLDLLSQLRPHWRRDRNLPARIQSLLARQRAFGSRDRRLYRELIYTTLRYLPWIEPALDRSVELALPIVAWLAAGSRTTENFRAPLITGWPPPPPTVAARAAILATRISPAASEIFRPDALLPEWFREHAPEIFEPAQIDVVLARAPLWLRLQTDDASFVTEEFTRLGWRWQRSPVLDSAVQIFDPVDVTKTSSYTAGLVEVQDLGSQLLLESAGIARGESWLDACAGAGGKTLQLARLLGPAGKIDAFDVRPAALRELAARATRTGIAVTTAGQKQIPSAAPKNSGSFASLRIVAAPDSSYDGVLVDAPCSGSGTWRRAPHLKWTTSAAEIANASALQRTLLADFSRRVRPGGRLIYATCSLSRHENGAVVAHFLETHPDFAAEAPRENFGASFRDDGLTFLPAQHDTDGFFVAALRRQV